MLWQSCTQVHCHDPSEGHMSTVKEVRFTILPTPLKRKNFLELRFFLTFVSGSLHDGKHRAEDCLFVSVIYNIIPMSVLFNGLSISVKREF